MAYDLEAENRQLRRQLREFLAEARQNEEKLRRFDELERRMIGTRSPLDLIRTAVEDYRDGFELDAVTIALIDPEYELLRMLEHAGHKANDMPELMFLTGTSELDAAYGIHLRPVLSPYTDRYARMFSCCRRPPASVALLPLVRQEGLIGSLNLGSERPDRFVDGAGTNFLERLAGIFAISLENAANHERLKIVGLIDPLTTINNRRYFEQRLMEAVSYAQRHGEALSCMFLDVDRFKRINDTLGHQAGDEVLRSTAQYIKSQLRPSDVLARYGGEEFVVLLPNIEGEAAVEIAERIRSGVERRRVPVREQDEPLQITISIGVAALPRQRQALESPPRGEDLVSAADQAVYRAKNSGRNRVVWAVLQPVD